jgi:hypothetical protein
MEIMDLIFEFLFGREGVTQAIGWFLPAIMAAGSAIGAIGSASANRKNERKLRAMENEEKQDYLREYYRGALDNEGSRAYLKKLDERLKRSDKATENALTASGATHENALAVKQANNEVYSDAVSNLVENEQTRKDQVRAGHKEAMNTFANAQMQQNANQAQTWSQVGQGISSAAAGLGEATGWENPWKK